MVATGRGCGCGGIDDGSSGCSAAGGEVTPILPGVTAVGRFSAEERMLAGVRRGGANGVSVIIPVVPRCGEQNASFPTGGAQSATGEAAAAAMSRGGDAGVSTTGIAGSNEGESFAMTEPQPMVGGRWSSRRIDVDGRVSIKRPVLSLLSMVVLLSMTGAGVPSVSFTMIFSCCAGGKDSSGSLGLPMECTSSVLAVSSPSPRFARGKSSHSAGGIFGFM